VPSGKTAAEPFAVIREAMASQGRVALGKVVMASRERRVAVEARKSGLLVTTLRSHDEVRGDAAVFDAVPEARINPQMVEIAKQIIAQQAGPFDPEDFRDRYEDAVRELVEQGRRRGAEARGRGARGGQRHQPDGRAAAQPEGGGGARWRIVERVVVAARPGETRQSAEGRQARRAQIPQQAGGLTVPLRRRQWDGRLPVPGPGIGALQARVRGRHRKSGRVELRRHLAPRQRHGARAWTVGCTTRHPNAEPVDADAGSARPRRSRTDLGLDR
jgi:hypothetical protein